MNDAERAAHNRMAMSEGMRRWNASRSPEQKEASRQKQADAVVMQMWIPKGPRTYHGPRPGNSNGGGKRKVDPNTPVGGTTLAKIERASVKRILKDLVGTQPELIKDAIIAGLLAPPPRSFPYLALAAAYLDGKPGDAASAAEAPNPQDYSNLTREELRARALQIAERFSDEMEKRNSEVIDAEVIPESLEELKVAVAKAEEDKRRADAEAAQFAHIQRVIKMNEEPK